MNLSPNRCTYTQQIQSIHDEHDGDGQSNGDSHATAIAPNLEQHLCEHDEELWCEERGHISICGGEHEDGGGEEGDDGGGEQECADGDAWEGGGGSEGAQCGGRLRSGGGQRGEE